MRLCACDAAHAVVQRPANFVGWDARVQCLLTLIYAPDQLEWHTLNFLASPEYCKLFQTVAVVLQYK